ncbi:NADH-quinone oxidoreductase subunit D [Granulicoccus sp. GXG6511]|uniref:NADH-quinone oxidoreductase subunit D-related protein n=1 Tax=Granulicoccus sp. GXG6511 TaxID=3381351 RepID=UPI003D7DA159
MTTQRILVGSLAAGLPADAATIILDLGPDHPTRAGLLEINVVAAGDVVTSARVLPGAMHRGVEKLFEARDYRQILMLADRHDWQAPFFGELAAAEAFEGLLRLTPPPRAAWLRTLLAEHTRILSHLGFLGWVARTDVALATRVRAARERLRGQTSRLTGNRIHPMAVRIGGVAVDPDGGWLDDEATLMTELSQLAQELAGLPLPGDGLAMIDADLVDSFGLSGPLARAAGVPLDNRHHGPYAELGFDITRLGTTGDARARFALLAAECQVSADVVRTCCARLPDGPIQVRLPKIVKLPEAESYSFVEAPLGRTGFHLVSRGDKTPWRMKLRSPSFHHVAALEELLVGTPVAAVETVLASVGYVIGDVDK